MKVWGRTRWKEFFFQNLDPYRRFVPLSLLRITHWNRKWLGYITRIVRDRCRDHAAASFYQFPMKLRDGSDSFVNCQLFLASLMSSVDCVAHYLDTRKPRLKTRIVTAQQKVSRLPSTSTWPIKADFVHESRKIDQASGLAWLSQSWNCPRACTSLRIVISV